MHSKLAAKYFVSDETNYILNNYLILKEKVTMKINKDTKYFWGKY